MCSENQDLRQMSSKLLSVEPHRLSDLSSFEKLQEVVGDWSTDRWQEFWGDQLRPTRSSDPKWANVLESWAALSLQEKDHATASLALAVMLGIAAVFVANPAGKVGFGIKADYWFLMNLQPKGIEGDRRGNWSGYMARANRPGSSSPTGPRPYGISALYEW